MKHTTAGARVPTILGPQHSELLNRYLDENPLAVAMDAIDALADQFMGLTISKTTLYRHIKQKCKCGYTFKIVDHHIETRKKRQAFASEWKGREDDFCNKSVFVD